MTDSSKNAIATTLGRRCLLATTTALAAAAALPRRTWAAERPLKFGLCLEYTGGSSGTTSESVQLGVDLALAELNAGGGIAGRKVTRIIADTQTDATVGVGEMKRLVQQDKVDVVIGPVISQIALAVAPVLNAANVASFGSTGSLSITPAVAPYYFSTLVSAAAQADKMASYAAQALHAKSGAIISDSGAQAKDFVQNMRREMQAVGIRLTGVQEYQYRAIDMTPQLLALKHGRADTLFLFASSGEDAGNVIKSLGDVGWNPPVTGNWTLGTFVDAMEKVCGAAALENVTGSNYAGFTYCAGGAQPKPYLDFAARAKQFNGGPAARLSLTMAALFYDAVMLFKAAAEGSGGKTDGATIASWIERNGASFRGIAGPIAPSRQSHFLYGSDALAVVHPARRGEDSIQERVTC